MSNKNIIDKEIIIDKSYINKKYKLKCELISENNNKYIMTKEVIINQENKYIDLFIDMIYIPAFTFNEDYEIYIYLNEELKPRLNKYYKTSTCRYNNILDYLNININNNIIIIKPYDLNNFNYKKDLVIDPIMLHYLI